MLGGTTVSGYVANIEFGGGLYGFGIKFNNIPRELQERLEEILSMAGRVPA